MVMRGRPQRRQQARRVGLVSPMRLGPILQQQAFDTFETLVNGIYLLLAVWEAWLARTEIGTRENET